MVSLGSIKAEILDIDDARDQDIVPLTLSHPQFGHISTSSGNPVCIPVVCVNTEAKTALIHAPGLPNGGPLSKVVLTIYGF